MRQISHRCKIDTKACFHQIHWSIVNAKNVKYAYNSKQNTSITSSSSVCLTSERISLAFQHNSFFSILSSASNQTEQSRILLFILFEIPIPFVIFKCHCNPVHKSRKRCHFDIPHVWVYQIIMLSLGL